MNLGPIEDLYPYEQTNYVSIIIVIHTSAFYDGKKLFCHIKGIHRNYFHLKFAGKVFVFFPNRPTLLTIIGLKSIKFMGRVSYTKKWETSRWGTTWEAYA